MKVTVLGASGGIGGDTRTTSLLVDDDVLVDAGTGVCDLSVEALARLDHVFLTHSHLDHCVSIPFLVDTVGRMRDRPLTVHALPETLSVLSKHMFNWHLWPDFRRIPDADRPYLRFEPLAAGETRVIRDRQLTSVPVNHVLPALGYLISGGAGTIAFSGDTTVTESFWSALNARDDLHHLIIECAVPDQREEIAHLAKHLCPKLLQAELRKLETQVPVYITHLMPGEEDQVMAQIKARLPEDPPRALARGMVLTG